MAIKALAWMVRAFEPPVYCYHEIVHNQLVVKRFEESGVIFVDDIAACRRSTDHAFGPRFGPRVVAAARPRVAMSSTRSVLSSPRSITK